MISTSDYLIQVKALEESIEWYEKTIFEIEKQNNKRRVALMQLEYQLMKLKEDFKNG